MRTALSFEPRTKCNFSKRLNECQTKTTYSDSCKGSLPICEQLCFTSFVQQLYVWCLKWVKSQEQHQEEKEEKQPKCFCWVWEITCLGERCYIFCISVSTRSSEVYQEQQEWECSEAVFPSKASQRKWGQRVFKYWRCNRRILQDLWDFEWWKEFR